MSLEPIANLLKNDAIIFYSDFGKKAVEESWTKRLNKQIKSVDQVKDFTNINIATGRDSLLVDIDLDCSEAIMLSDYFIPPTELEFGRESTPRAHRLFKVIDLAQKNTRTYCSFVDKTKSMLVEIRANKHYTMCYGQYENQEKVVWNKSGIPTETTWEALNKSVALLGVACVILRKYANEGLRNEYIRKMVATLWQHKLEQSDTENIIRAVTTAAGDDTKERLARVVDVYKRDRTDQIQGLPSLAKEFNWSQDEVKDFKKLLFKITGRDVVPEFTHEFVNRIAYMMKQKKYYDLEDKEMYDAEAIDVKYAKYFPNYTPLKWWKMHRDSRVCVDFTYKPGDQNRFVNVSKKLMINVYEKNDLEPDNKVDTDVYYDLLKTVIPHDAERNHFLDWKAYQYQNPGKKIRHALILQSDEFQLGKGSLFDVHRDILGHSNTRKIELEEALDKGKGYLINAITVLIDEAKSSGSWSEKAKLINTLKTIISEGSIGVRQLYKEYAEQDTCTNYWINTNYRDAFPLPANEVRYWVYFSPGKRNDALLDRYHLHREKYNLAAGVYAELLDRNLDKFKPLGVAPHTIYRDQMCKLADRPLNDYVKEAFEQGVFPFDRDMLTTVELFDFLKTEKRMKVTREREIANAIELIGGRKKAGCPVDGVGSKVTIWIIRDYDKYKNLTAAELGKKYVGFFTDKRLKPVVATPMREDEPKSVGGAEDGIHF